MAFDLSERASGILLHLTSLPGPHGSGDLGPQAHAFARLLHGVGQRWWQMLPVGPLGYGNSPYSAHYSFAGNPLLISLERLAEEGLLSRAALTDAPRFRSGRVDYAATRAWRMPHLRNAFAAHGRRTGDHPQFEAFCAANAGWLEDFALYAAIKRSRGDRPWTEWEPDLRSRDRAALDRARRVLRAEIDQQRFEQYLFDDHWQARLDHFIGFTRYWEVPGREDTAKNGRWRPGPGAKLFEALGPAQLIAEDLGDVTPEVTALRERFGFPGMRVLQFAFGTDPQAKAFLPHNYERNSVAYTGTHDNDTTFAWFHDCGSPQRAKEQCEKERRMALAYLGVKDGGREIHWDMIRAVWSSVANLAIAPVQDLLGLGSEARMNLPGTTEGNWEWRLEALPDAAVLERLGEMTGLYGRSAR